MDLVIRGRETEDQYIKSSSDRDLREDDEIDSRYEPVTEPQSKWQGEQNSTAAPTTTSPSVISSDAPSPAQYPAQLVKQDAYHRPPKIGGDVFSKSRRVTQLDRMINPIPTHLPLCDKCKNIDFDLIAGHNTEQLFFESFSALQQSAGTCPMCALVFNSIHKHAEFLPSQDSRIWLIGYNSGAGELSFAEQMQKHKSVRGSNTIWGIKTVFNCLDPGPDIDDNGNPIYIGRTNVTDEPGLDGVLRVESTVLDVFANSNSIAARSCAVSERPISSADDMTQPIDWLMNCISNHADCKSSAEAARAQGLKAGPSRLLNLREDGTVQLSVVEPPTDAYLALSYRWPSTGAVITTTSNISQHLEAINVSQLSKTIREAIHITRQLGFKCLWVDSLCIIQDDEDDWASEAANMANIYQLATLTLSASVSTANDEGLLLSRRTTTDVRIPYNRKDIEIPCDVFATDRSWTDTWPGETLPSSFQADVSEGALSSRGWCLQERVLSRRILHFGKDQLHWECLDGYMSESSVSPYKLNSRLPEGRLRGPLVSGLTFEDMPLDEERSKVDIPPELINMGFGALFQALQGPSLFGEEPYASWYSLITQYTQRDLTKKTDKLVALSGLARAFSRYSEDSSYEYIAGLWGKDLVRGLLWHRVSMKLSDHSEERWSPTWSWVSVDGPVKWPHPLYGGNLGDTDFDWLNAHCVPATSDEFGAIGAAFLRVSGRVRRFTGMRGFDAEYADWLDSNEADLDYDCNPVPILDAKFYLYDLHCLLVIPVGCHSNCRHALGCDRDGMAWALMLLRHTTETALSRVGAAPLGSVYERVGLAKVFLSSFDEVPFQEIAIG